MTTLRGRFPVLLSELIAKDVEITFGHHMREPVISWKFKDGSGGHYHLDDFVPGVHGGNMLLMESVLTEILEKRLEKK